MQFSANDDALARCGPAQKGPLARALDLFVFHLA
jgi:hypothetical protein